MSSKLRTLERRNLILGGLAAALVAVVVLRSEPTVSAKKESLPLVFAQFAPDDARRVEIQAEPAGSAVKKLALEMAEDGRWTLASHHRYPLQAGADRLLDAVARARRSALVTRRAETFDQYAGTDGWTDVTVLDSRGRTLAAFSMGKYQYPETFLRITSGNTQEIVKATNIVPNVASTEVTSWVDTRIWPALTASKLIRLDVEQRRDERTITLVKRGESAADVEMGVPEADEKAGKIWWMAAPEEADAKKIAVEDLTREFTGMLLEDVAWGPMTDEDKKTLGFDDPEIVATVWQKQDGDKPPAKHVIEVGKKADDKSWYVRRRGADWVFRVGSSNLSRMRQMPGDFVDKPEPEAPANGDAEASGNPDGGELPAVPPPPPPAPPKDDAPKKKDG